jgi:hypothetical protein
MLLLFECLLGLDEYEYGGGGVYGRVPEELLDEEYDKGKGGGEP